MHRILRIALLLCLFAPMTWADDPHAGMDHGTMDHGTMDHAKMDHAKMDHGAGTPSCHEAPAVKPSAETPAIPLGDLTLPDLELLDQDGRSRRFVSDVLAGRRVVMNFVFTTCTTVCPPMGATFGRLQELLGDRLGDDVVLVSVSVDPAVDTPERLAVWSDRFGRRPGWTLLTGPKLEVDRLLKALQVFTPDKVDHAPIALVGDPERGIWQRAYGLASPQQMVDLVDGLGETPSESPAEAVAANGTTVQGVGR